MPVYGDDPIMPSLFWADTLAFLKDNSGAKPPMLEDYDIIVVDDNVNCFGASNAGVGRFGGLGVVLGVWLFVGILGGGV